MSKQPQIRLRIGKLALYGVPAADTNGVRRGLERELGRLLIERGLPESVPVRSAPLTRVDARPAHTTTDPTAGGLGRDAARVVHARLPRAR